MSGGQGRGRGEASKIARIEAEEGSTSARGYTGVQQPGGSTVVEVPERSSSSSEGEPEKTIRGRGGFRGSALHTIPAGIKVVKATGPQGQQVELMSNFIKINPMPQRNVHKYRVDFEPNIESVIFRKKLFNDNIKPRFTNQMIVFDGMSDARSGHDTHQELTVKAEHPSQKDEKIIIKIKKVGIVDNQYEQIRLYNMNMKNFLRILGFFRSGNAGAYVHPELKTMIGESLVTVRGYRTSANVHEGGNILMSMESCHKIMQRSNVLEVMAGLKSGNFKMNIINALTGKLVITNYNKEIYRIESVLFDKTPRSTFLDHRNNKEVSFLEYYKSRYNIAVSDQSQPLLLAVPNNARQGERSGDDKREVLLIPELCNIAGLTDRQRNDNRLKVDLIKSSQIPPSDRVSHLRVFMEKLHNNEDIKRMLDQWGYSYDNKPVIIKGRILPLECVGLGKYMNMPPDKWPKVDQSGGFEREVMREKLARPAPFEKLIIMISRTDAANERNITNKLRSGFERVGLCPRQVEFAQIREGDSPSLYVQYLRQVTNNTTATLVIMPQQNKERYDAIKKFASVERGMITQVVTARLMMDDRKASGAAIKIGIQVAAKIGGEPWHLSIPLSQVMICGYDTYHDTLNRGRSYGAFIASMNNKFSRWFSKADSHDRIDELSAHMADNFALSLRKYREVNKVFPERVFIYRDGVGEGQLEHVFNTELKLLRKAARDVDNNIRLAYIIVNKRVGARFYMRAGNNFSNPPPGTVIDDVVTRKERYDFYLVSQSTRHGTVAPTYYNIIHDESGLDPAKHQMLAFKMCFLYYNWTGTVRVPAPCQYAHKLALLCGEHLHSVPSNVLDDRLHFL